MSDVESTYDHSMSDCVKIFRETENAVGHYSITWTFRNFSFLIKETGENVNLEPFVTGKDEKIEWELLLFPNGNVQHNNDYVSVFLKPLKVRRVIAKVAFSALNKDDEKVHRHSTDVKLFTDDDWGFARFAKREYLLNEENGFLIDDVLVLCIELHVVEDFMNFTNQRQIKRQTVNGLTSDFQNLFNSRKFADLTMAVGNERFQVHKLILASRSSVFSAMFEHDMTEKNTNTLTITDIEPKVMEEVLKYIYFGKCNLKEMATEILPVSDKYNLLELKELCEETLCEQLSIDTAPLSLILSDFHNLAMLKKNTLNYISINAKKVFGSCDWKSVVDSHPHVLLQAYEYVIQKNILVQADEKSEA